MLTPFDMAVIEYAQKMNVLSSAVYMAVQAELRNHLGPVTEEAKMAALERVKLAHQ